jgi:DNA topoisomerase-1
LGIGASSTKAVLVEVVKTVAMKLGNKPATCRKYYIHPRVTEHYTLGTLRDLADQAGNGYGKNVYERIVLALVTSKRRARATPAVP